MELSTAIGAPSSTVRLFVKTSMCKYLLIPALADARGSCGPPPLAFPFSRKNMIWTSGDLFQCSPTEKGRLSSAACNLPIRAFVRVVNTQTMRRFLL